MLEASLLVPQHTKLSVCPPDNISENTVSDNIHGMIKEEVVDGEAG
jgi:hypothetical protein